MNVMNNLRARVAGASKAPSLLNQESTMSQSSKEQVQVEPKTYFANERTFIQWISAALLLLTVSSIMMGSGNFNGTSSVIAFSSLILVTYASFVYFRRVQLLRSGDAYGYLDFVGPTILALGVGAGVFIVFADAVKGSEFLTWGSEREYSNKYGSGHNRRVLHEMQVVESIMELQQVDGQCARHNIEGIKMLEYQPRDIVLNANDSVVVATPQSLVAHPLLEEAARSTILSEIPDIEIQSLTIVGDHLFALSTGPAATEVVEFNVDASIEARYLILDAPSTAGSMVFVGEGQNGKFYIYLDGQMHSYNVPSKEDSVLSRTGSINMKVLNHGMNDSEDPITAMEHFDGLTYVLRGRQNIIEAWDLTRATKVSDMPLPSVSSSDKWVGMAFERKNAETSALRKNTAVSSVYLHMPLDTFPPQLWSFRLGKENGVFAFPECGVSMN